MPEPRQESRPATPVVMPEAAAVLYQRLAEQGRANDREGVQGLMRLLVRALEQQWETTAVRRFSDKTGGGWFVDLSRYFDGEMLYGLVRTSLGGGRLLTTIVDADEVETFGKTGQWQTPAAQGSDEVESVSAAETRKLDGVPMSVSDHKMSDGPVLVVVYHMPLPDLLSAGIEVFRCETRAQATEKIADLIRSGLRSDPVSEDQIEVWSNVSKPKFEIRF